MLRRMALVLSLTPATAASAQQADLATGVRQVQNGDFEQALLTLDIVARQFAPDAGKSKDLAQAYLYMGVAYVGLGQDVLARSRFEKALQNDATLHLSPDEFPPRVLRTFEAASQERAERATLQREVKRKRGKGGLVLLGLGGAGAVGLTLAVTTKERANLPPTVALTISPEGEAIVGVTRMTLTANASDPEGEPLRYSWSFGDGTSASGQVATHVYTRQGAFPVNLVVADGLTSTAASGQVTVQSMAGIWRVVGQAFAGVTEFEFSEGTPSFNFIARGAETMNAPGLWTDPRSVVLSYSTRGRRPDGTTGSDCSFRFDGQGDALLRTIMGTLACSDPSGICGTCGGQTQALTLARQ